MSDTSVRLSAVSKHFRSGPEVITVLSGLNLAVEEGESVAITGPSGSGKTTLLNIIGGLDSADEGTVLLGDIALSGLDEHARAQVRGSRVGFVFQFHYLLRDFTAVENAMLPALIVGARRRVAHRRAVELLGMVGLSSRLDHYPHQLSGGERQRVAIARALMNDPSILLADEPTGNLDPDHAQGVEDLMFSTSEHLGKTLLVVSHDPRPAARARRHLVLDHGTLEEA